VRLTLSWEAVGGHNVLLRTFQMQHIPELYFSATVGQEPEIELALVLPPLSYFVRGSTAA
jgi:hypothetical protein